MKDVLWPDVDEFVKIVINLVTEFPLTFDHLDCTGIDVVRTMWSTSSTAELNTYTFNAFGHVADVVAKGFDLLFELETAHPAFSYGFTLNTTISTLTGARTFLPWVGTLSSSGSSSFELVEEPEG